MAKPDTQVKWYSSGMFGAPSVTNAYGNLTGLLDAVLANGFAVKPVDNLTFKPATTGGGGTVTCHISTGHKYNVDQVVSIAGATQADYNGEFRVKTVSTDSFTYDIDTIPQFAAATTVSSLSAKVAPLGFEIAFSRTNKRAYRSLHPESLGNMLVVDDGIKDTDYGADWAKWANVAIAESMTDIDTIVGAQAPFDPNVPLQNWKSQQQWHHGWHKWYFARTGGHDTSGDSGGGNRNWVVVGDGRMFYLFITGAAGYGWYGRDCYCFGDIISFKPGDQYSTVLHAEDHYWTHTQQHSSYPGQFGGYGGITSTLDNTGNVLLRNHTQLGNYCRWSCTSLNTNNSSQQNGRGGIPFPNGPDYSLWLMPVYCRQEDSHMRGMMPGMRWLPQWTGYSDLTVIDNVAGQEGRKFLFVRSQYSNESEGCTTPFDVTGPWR